MIVALSVLTVLFLGAFVALWSRAVRHMQDQNQALRSIVAILKRPNRDLEEVFSERLKLLEQDLEGLPRKWEAIKREAAAAETRARYHTRRALEELEEHGYTSPGVETVAAELFPSDAEGSGTEGLQPLHQDVAGEPGPSTVGDDDYLTLAWRRKHAG